MTVLVVRSPGGKAVAEGVRHAEGIETRPPADDGWNEGAGRVAAYLLIVALSGFLLAVVALLAVVVWMM